MKKIQLFLKKHWAGAVIVGMAVFVLVGGFALWELKKEPQPQGLGPQLTYVGKRDFGCILWWCETHDYSVYYFSTDMSKEELRTYFKTKDAEPAIESHGGSGATYQFDDLSYKTEYGDFSVTFFYDYDDVTEIEPFLRTDKKHIIEILDSDYAIAKSVL